MFVSNLNLSSSNSVYTMTTSNLAVLSYMVNRTDLNSNGFTLQTAANSSTSNITLVYDVKQIDFNQVKSSAFLNQRVLSKMFDSGSQSKLFLITLFF
jgi:hypothetical protein